MAFSEAVKEYIEEKMQMNEFQKYVKYINKNQKFENHIFYEVNITLKIKKGKVYLTKVGARQTNSLCSLPKYNVLCDSYAKGSNNCKWAKEEKKKKKDLTYEEVFSLSREKLYPEDRFDYLDITSCLPSLSYLIQKGVFYEGDMYKWLSGKEFLQKGTDEREIIVKGCTLPALFSKKNYKFTQFLKDRYRYAKKKNKLTKEMIDKNLDLIKKVYIRARELNPNHNTMLFYHESNIEIMIRFFLKKLDIYCYGQVYDGFYIEKGIISEKDFNKVVEDLSLIYYNNFIKGEKSVDKLFDLVYIYAKTYKNKRVA